MLNSKPECMQSLVKEDATIHQAMQLTTAIALPMALKTAIDLGILEILEKAGPNARLSPSELASRLAPSAEHQAQMSEMIDRILRLLSSYSVVSCFVVKDDGLVRRLYSLAPLSRYFLPSKDDHGSLAPLFNMIHDKFMTDIWYYQKDAILEGELPLTKAYGTNPQDAIGKDERFGPIFSNSLKEFNHLIINKILDEYMGFKDIKVIVDVGGGNGSLLKAIIAQYPDTKGINFDLPHIVEQQHAYPGIEHIAGDMLTSIPAGDAIFMKWVLRLQNDEQCLKVLKNCYKALPEGGKLMIAELGLPDIPDSTIATQSIFQFDVYLANMNAWGKDRTTREYEALAMAAGFSGIQAMVTAFDQTLLEFHKIVGPTKHTEDITQISVRI